MGKLNVQHLFFNLFVKILQTPVRNGFKPCLPDKQAFRTELRTCSRRFSIICVALLLGCGYQMVGKETHIPSNLTSIAIPTFLNQTLEPGVEVPFTQGFLREFINDKRVRVVERREADSILEGVIKSLNIYSVAYDKSGIAIEYQTTVVVDLTLRNRNGQILWKEQDLSETRWYRTTSSVLASESSKAAAIQQIGTFMAERIRNRFFYEF
jgi:outer membrane lipopolysaccharide assembly protein LptE/RlpB